MPCERFGSIGGVRGADHQRRWRGMRIVDLVRRWRRRRDDCDLHRGRRSHWRQRRHGQCRRGRGRNAAHFRAWRLDAATDASRHRPPRVDRVDGDRTVASTDATDTSSGRDVRRFACRGCGYGAGAGCLARRDGASLLRAHVRRPHRGGGAEPAQDGAHDAGAMLQHDGEHLATHQLPPLRDGQHVQRGG